MISLSDKQREKPAMCKSVMPPLGLMPERIFEELNDAVRRQDLIDAIKRYSESGKPIPMAWIDELERRMHALVSRR